MVGKNAGTQRGAYDDNQYPAQGLEGIEYSISDSSLQATRSSATTPESTHTRIIGKPGTNDPRRMQE